MDYAALLHGPAYTLYGRPATITPVNGAPVPISAIDRTSGVELMSDSEDRFSGGLGTVQPAALVRVADLDAAGLTRAGLNRAVLVLNGKTWRIDSAIPKPTTNGEADGELLLLLSGG
ncbi:hypothetical protein AA309_20205 [Microvirga vignae]|uniref:Phage head-tail adapter protein n=1 Tax=Microvirga vignae TaxID=1225564 RepID=A0A0H1R876_9HYPH|nr:hypothetical protein [Microvirga vignae]KLK91420.1 hypothetical protein AA309_20205 [Microvirga vignae]